MIREIRALLRNSASQNDQQGFTLIEMSIVLAIIGLIVGGILKGQEVVNNARLKTQIAQMDAIKSSVYTFQDEYSYLPGDYPYAANNFAIASGNGDGNGLIGATSASTLSDIAESSGTESVLAWAHLEAANLIGGVQLPPGTSITSVTSSTQLVYAGKMANTYVWLGTYTVNPPGATTTPATAVMARLQGVQFGTLAQGGQQALRETDASNLDRRYDDGNPSTGSILAGSSSDSGNCAKGNSYSLNPATGNQTNTYCTLFWVIE